MVTAFHDMGQICVTTPEHRMKTQMPIERITAMAASKKADILKSSETAIIPYHK